MDMMSEDPNILRATSPFTTGNPQAEIRIDPVKASAMGLNPSQVMGNIYTMMQGSKATDLTIGTRTYDIRVEYPDDLYENISDLSSLYLSNNFGEMVPLLDVATIVYSDSPQTITRQNGRYMATVTGQPSSGAPDSLASDLNAKASALDLPDGVEITQSAQMNRSRKEFPPCCRRSPRQSSWSLW
jgi:multidrug efflux pump subunit AcrB